MLTHAMKGRFPFKLGTTSCILHDHILPNVHFLKESVDMIELLVFESDEQSNYPSREDLRTLRKIAEDYQLTYTVHLPIGIPLGCKDSLTRRRHVDLFLRAIDATRDLQPHAWDLHLEADPDWQTQTEARLDPWQSNCQQSLQDLKDGGADPQRIGIETLEYPFAFAEPVVESAGFGTCLDIGHCWYRNHDEDWFIQTLLPRARSIHLHGFNHERDHRGLNHLPPAQLKRFIDAVKNLPNPEDRCVSIEVFGIDHLTQSWEALNALT